MQQHNDFLAGEILPGVSFSHNDSVEVVPGPHAGPRGSVISVEELGADPLLLIELDPGGDITFRQSIIRLSKGQSMIGLAADGN
jgi:hypothetical protein